MEKYKSDYERYEEAKKQVKEIKGFYVHLFVYVAVNLFLIFINLKYSSEHLWFFWATMGWGIGVLFHGLGVFKVMPFFGKNWEEDKIKELMEKDKKQKWE